MTILEVSVDAFNHWRYDRTAAMTLVDLCHGGALYYYDSPYNCAVWVFANTDSLLISYWFKGVTRGGVRTELKRLLDALHGTGNPAALSESLYPKFAALCRPGEESVTVACFHLGDWFGLSRAELPPRWDQLPPGWPESERQRIELLVEERLKIVLAWESPEAIYPVGRALVALRKFHHAEAMFRRMLALMEKVADTNGIASATQSLGTVLAYLGRLDEAVDLLARAVQLWTAAQGPNGSRVASARAPLGRVSALRDQRDPG